jgi:acetamidase/formamidase
VALHEIPLERRALHGHFSRDLEPVLTVDSGDSVAFACLNSGWRNAQHEPFPERREGELDAGHALVGPIAIRGARAGATLEVRIDELRIGAGGVTQAGGWSTPLNERLGLEDGETLTVLWELDADTGLGRSDTGREVTLAPFLGVIGLPPDEPGVHSTAPPRPSGGNIDCKELVAGTTLFLPIPVDGALFSAGDGHAVQGDGELSGTAIECPVERAVLTLDLRDDLDLRSPIARIDGAWLALGFDEDLDLAAEQAAATMLDLMERELGIDRDYALGLASVAVDMRITQVVNGVKGVHAVLRDDAIR